MTSYFPEHSVNYFDLLKRCLMGWPYANFGYKTTKQERTEGRYWPDIAHTLLSLSRLNNIEECCIEVIADQIPGDFMECGVWRGGACILMKAIIDAKFEGSRKVIVADSFEGVPPPTLDIDMRETFHNYGYLSVSLEQVKDNFSRYGLLDDRVQFMKGWFKDITLDSPLAVLRLDGDLYSSTMECLERLYKNVSVGGFVIVDDYVCMAHVRAAVDDFRRDNRITEGVVGVDWSAVYWRKLR
jgi:hypothetical protein